MCFVVFFWKFILTTSKEDLLDCLLELVQQELCGRFVFVEKFFGLCMIKCFWMVSFGDFIKKSIYYDNQFRVAPLNSSKLANNLHLNSPINIPIIFKRIMWALTAIEKNNSLMLSKGFIRFTNGRKQSTILFSSVKLELAINFHPSFSSFSLV